MNRDEAWQRAEADALRICVPQDSASSYAMYPQDLQAGGTWMGANSFGLGFALLNRYQDPQRADAERSRGELIPLLLLESTIVAARTALQSLADKGDLSAFNPFDLLLFGAQVEVLRASWNGANLSWHQHATPGFFSSSAVRTAEALAYRDAHFQRWLSAYGQHTQPDALVLSALHWSSDPNLELAIRMRRPLSHSKSVCQLLLSPSQVRLHYWNQQALEAFDSVAPHAGAQCHTLPRLTH